MTDTTANLGLPVIVAAQAQKHVTHNEALLLLDTLVQLAVLDRDLSAPPGSPGEGERWIVADGATGAWDGREGDIAAWQDGAWRFATPQLGWVAFVADEGTLLVWNGSAWGDFFSTVTSIQNLTRLGVGTAADATNPLSAKLNNTLWTAKTVAEGGDGHLRYKLSKESAAKTLSLLFQTAYSGRAEIGLTGDDDFHFKVSADGSAWSEALTIDRATGGIRFLAHESDVASAATCDIGAAASLKVRITGTTAITSFGSEMHRLRLVRFAGALTLTHNATSLILPNGGGDIATEAGDTALAVSDASGNWRVMVYQRASGEPLQGGGGGGGAGRELLSAARTYYVRTDGSDSNDGLSNSSGGAFLTVQKAIDAVAALDLGVHDATIQIGNGTYSGANQFKSLVGAGKCIVKGDSATPSNVVISVTGADAFGPAAGARGTYELDGLKLQTTTSGNAVYAYGAGLFVRVKNLDFGACAGAHLASANYGAIQIVGNYAITGGAGRHLFAVSAAIDRSAGWTVTLSGTPAFSAPFAAAYTAANVNMVGMSYSGSATGTRYMAAANAVIDTNGGGASFFPGDSAGSTATGGQYV